MPAPVVKQVLFSVALNHPRTITPGFFGHEAVYQQILVAAARRAAIDAAVLLPFASDNGGEGVMPLCSGGRTNWAEGLTLLLRQLDDREATVLFYEGSIEVLRFVEQFARAHQQVVFVVNLFERDSELAFPSLSQRSFVAGLQLRSRDDGQWSAELRRFVKNLPPNVVIYADTERRRVLAQALGIRNVRVWPLYSVVRTDEFSAAKQPSGRNRIVIPVAARQVTRQLMYEIAAVVELTRRYSATQDTIEWLVFGGGYDAGWRHRSRGRRMRRLHRLGVRFEPSGLPGDRYAQTLTEADIVWLPQRGFYTTQSSGKVADALVVGTPVIAPNGSYPAQEMNRWIPGAPAYTGVREAVELFLRADLLAPTLKRELATRREGIAWWYSPDRAVREVMDASAAARNKRRGKVTEVATQEEGALPRLPDAVAGVNPTIRERITRILGTRRAQLRAGFVEFAVWVKTVMRFR